MVNTIFDSYRRVNWVRVKHNCVGRMFFWLCIPLPYVHGLKLTIQRESV